MSPAPVLEDIDRAAAEIGDVGWLAKDVAPAKDRGKRSGVRAGGRGGLREA